MRRLRLLTTGESHGPGLYATLTGLPAGLTCDLVELERQMKRRMHGYGRGNRMKIESDSVELQAGIRGGVTLGSPIGLWIENKDHEKAWKGIMGAGPLDSEKVQRRRVHSPRPGHADLAGGIKYHFEDLRDVLERASARETAARVAAGTFARMLLAEFDIEIMSGVRSLGAVGTDAPAPTWEQMQQVDDSSPLRAVDPGLEPDMVALVDQATKEGDTLGGSVTVIAHNVPAGLGSHTQWDLKLDGRVAQAMMSVPAVKGVEIGSAIAVANGFGSSAHDPIEYTPEVGFVRPTNRAGGTEGGITNGEDLVVTLFKKPISTLRQGMPSVDLDTLEASQSQYERSDVTALPAAGVVGEAMLALVLADALLDKLGGDSITELRAHWAATRGLQREWPIPRTE